MTSEIDSLMTVKKINFELLLFFDEKINELPNCFILKQDNNDWTILNSLEICSMSAFSADIQCDIRSHSSIISKTEDLFIDSVSCGIFL